MDCTISRAAKPIETANTFARISRAGSSDSVLNLPCANASGDSIGASAETAGTGASSMLLMDLPKDVHAQLIRSTNTWTPAEHMFLHSVSRYWRDLTAQHVPVLNLLPNNFNAFGPAAAAFPNIHKLQIRHGHLRAISNVSRFPRLTKLRDLEVSDVAFNDAEAGYINSLTGLRQLRLKASYGSGGRPLNSARERHTF